MKQQHDTDFRQGVDVFRRAHEPEPERARHDARGNERHDLRNAHPREHDDEEQRQRVGEDQGREQRVRGHALV